MGKQAAGKEGRFGIRRGSWRIRDVDPGRFNKHEKGDEIVTGIVHNNRSCGDRKTSRNVAAGDIYGTCGNTCCGSTSATHGS
jgi:hypothetical protein